MGLVVVPQGVAYASLARLSPAFGLYTTFTGACLYWIFGTSRDIVIGVSPSLCHGIVSSNTHLDYGSWFPPGWQCCQQG